MNSQAGIGLVRARWRVMLSILLLCLLAGALISAATPKRYEASAQLFVSTPSSVGSNLQAQQGFVVARVQSYVSLVNDPDLTSFVVEHLHLPMSAGALGHEISADAPVNKVLLNIHVQDASASRAALIVNAVANRFATTTEALENPRNAAESPVILTLTKEASPPRTPVQPRTKINLAIALLVGLLLAYAGGVLRARTDDTLRTAQDLESFTGCPVLGAVPRSGRSRRRRGADVAAGGHRAAGAMPATHGRGDSELARRALDLVTGSLDFLDLGVRTRVVAFTGVRPGVGTTDLTAQAARSLAASGEAVCLVDANLRTPELAHIFGLPAGPGLTGALTGRSTPDAVRREAAERLTVVPAGQLPPNPAQVLGSDRLREVLAELSAGSGRTLLDAAAVLPNADGVATAAMVDATVLVVRAGHTSRSDISAAMAAFAAAGSTPTAVVLTGARPSVVRRLLAARGAGNPGAAAPVPVVPERATASAPTAAVTPSAPAVVVEAVAAASVEASPPAPPAPAPPAAPAPAPPATRLVRVPPPPVPVPAVPTQLAEPVPAPSATRLVRVPAPPPRVPAVTAAPGPPVSAPAAGPPVPAGASTAGPPGATGYPTVRPGAVRVGPGQLAPTGWPSDSGPASASPA